MNSLYRFPITLPRLTIGQPLSVLIIFITSLGITLGMFMIAPISITHVGYMILQSHLLIGFLNWLPIFMGMLILFFITNNVVIPVGVFGFLISTLSFINRYKILLRNDPLFPWDFTLGAELRVIAETFPLYQFILAGGLLVGFLLVTIFGALVIRTRKGTFMGLELMSRKLSYGLNLAVAVLLILIATFINSTLYSDVALSNTLPVQGNVFNPVSRSNSWGFPYFFILAHNTQRLRLPSDFNAGPIKELEAEFVATSLNNPARPHLFIILAEAFSTIADVEGIDFEGFDYNPHEAWNRLVSRDDVISGHIVVPNVGGGTADTEFDVLTAFNTRALRGAPYSYRVVSHDFEAIPNLLAPLGYRSIALHPGFDWFYNRQNVFRYFGFEEFINIDDFDYPADWKGPYVSEENTINRLIELFEDHLENHPDVPLFQFIATIQNHGPYAGMYGIDVPNFNTRLDFTENELDQVSNYLHGLNDVTTELTRLIAYFEASDEPVVLVYFSDHAPGFTPGIFDQLLPESEPYERMENLLRRHIVPYFIWQNEAASKITPLKENANFLSRPEPMGSSFLGAYTMELLGFTGLSPFWDNVNSLRDYFPVVLEDRAFTPGREVSLDLPAEARSKLVTYRDWQFYRIFN